MTNYSLFQSHLSNSSMNHTITITNSETKTRAKIHVYHLCIYTEPKQIGKGYKFTSTFHWYQHAYAQGQEYTLLRNDTAHACFEYEKCPTLLPTANKETLSRERPLNSRERTIPCPFVCHDLHAKQIRHTETKQLPVHTCSEDYERRVLTFPPFLLFQLLTT